MKEVLAPIVLAVVTAVITWFFSRRKTNAEAKLAEIQARTAEKAAELDAAKANRDFFEELLNSSARRLNEQVELNNKNDQQIKTLLSAVKERDEKIELLLSQVKQRDKKIDLLISEMENLRDELKKYKQLNGKVV